jgi:quinoprotein glucose dehydrogenase
MKRLQKLNLFDFTMIVVGLVIGMGIFRTASISAKGAGTPVIFFSAWIAGGIIALCGALCFAEIGSRYPVTGGYYKIFSYAYHPSIAFSINCIVLISSAGAVSGVALIGSGYISQALFDHPASDTVKLVIAITAIIAFYGLNLLGLKMSARAQNVLMIIKIGMILLLILPLFIPSLWHHDVSIAGQAPLSDTLPSLPSPQPSPTGAGWIANFGKALVAVSFTYTGYQQTINFGNEVERPARNVPRSIFMGIAIIISLYMLVNLAYYKVLGFEELKQQTEVANTVASRLLGKTGGNFFSGLLFLSVLAYVNVYLMSNPRVMFAMSEDKVLPALFARRTAKRDVLAVSLTAFSAICIITLLFAKTFDQILSFTIFLDSLGMATSVGAIFMLRKRTRHLDNTGIYSMKGYPLQPIIFIAAYTFVAFSILWQSPATAGVGLLILLGFLLIYWIARRFNKGLAIVIPLLIVTAFSCNSGNKDKYTSWPVYGGSKENIHYSSLTRVDTSNVTRLQRAWEYHTKDGDSLSQIQVNPLVIDGILYGISPKLRLFALDAATGEPKWTFDPAHPLPGDSVKIAINACRGLAYYGGSKEDNGTSNANGTSTTDAPRLFYSAGSYLYCVDALTGQSVKSFGEAGKIDLHNDLGRDTKDLYVTSTTPGILYKNLLIIGDRVAEEAAAAPGHIRAYDVHTGRLKWIFHTIPYPGEKGYETWDDKEAYKHIGGANAWAGFSLDEEKGIVFAPIGSASYDFYGGRRLGEGLFANCVVALDAATGRRIWHFQTVHHDVWDRDPPAAPVLVTLHKDGRRIDAVAQITKSGFIFLLDRATGQPVYPVEERAVPTATELTGERLSPTQPFPTVLQPFVRQSLTEADLNTLVPDSSCQDLKRRLAGYKTGNMFTPPSKEGTIIFPGFDGGAEWGGPSYDPETGWLYVNASEMPWVLTMVDTKPTKPASSGRSTGGYAQVSTPASQTKGEAGRHLYTANCMSCHGPNRQGGGNTPSLIGISKKYTGDQLVSLVSSGRRMMPAFPQLSPEEKEALASFILDRTDQRKQPFTDTHKAPEDPYHLLPYDHTGYNKFLTKEGYPAVSPPWGTLTAIDLNTGVVAWKDTLGDYPELKAKGIHTGTENYGGSVVTAGGLLFIAATSDAKFRAFNKKTGRLLWETDLPAAGFATPSVYAVDGRQYIVIACGGGKLHKRSGDSYIAYSLPE